MARKAPQILMLAALIAVLGVTMGAKRSSGWNQFGGNNQDFAAPAGKLAVRSYAEICNRASLGV